MPIPQQTTELIFQMKGETVAMDAMVTAILCAMSKQQIDSTFQEFDHLTELLREMLLKNGGGLVLSGFESYIQRVSRLRI